MTTAQDYTPLLPLLVSHPPTSDDPVYGAPVSSPSFELGPHKVDQFERGIRCSCGWNRAVKNDHTYRFRLIEDHQRGI